MKNETSTKMHAADHVTMRNSHPTSLCTVLDDKKVDLGPKGFTFPYYKFMGTLKPSWESCTGIPSLSTIIEELTLIF